MGLQMKLIPKKSSDYNEDTYEIEYKKTTENEWKSVEMPEDGKLEFILVKDLDIGTLYDFRACAMNTKGRSPWKKFRVKTKCLPNRYNGATDPNKLFVWQQTADEVVIIVPLDKDMTSKDVSIMGINKIKICVNDVLIMDGIFFEEIVDYTWEIERWEDEKVDSVIVTIEKKKKKSKWLW